MAHPPLSMALHLVLSANLDGTARPGLLAAMREGQKVRPITRPGARTHVPAHQSRSNVLTMPRVIPLPRLGEDDGDGPDLDPDAA